MAGVDDEVMKMRLLVDGDGTGDDRKLHILLKTLLKWCNSDNEESVKITYERMLAHLAQIQWSMEKSRYVAKMNQDEMENYELIRSTIEDGITAAKQEIEDTKKELAEAKVIRKNRLEYDQLARVIHTHPDRNNSTERIASLDEEKKMLKEKEKALEEKLDTRRQQFTLLISTLHQLQSLLEDEDGSVKSNVGDSSQDSVLSSVLDENSSGVEQEVELTTID